MEHPLRDRVPQPALDAAVPPREAGRAALAQRDVMKAVFALAGGGDPEHSHPHREGGGGPSKGGLCGEGWHRDRPAEGRGVPVI